MYKRSRRNERKDRNKIELSGKFCLLLRETFGEDALNAYRTSWLQCVTRNSEAQIMNGKMDAQRFEQWFKDKARKIFDNGQLPKWIGRVG